MTLSTDIYFTEPVDPQEVYNKVHEFLGIDPEQPERSVREDGSIINTPMQGLPAWILVSYRNGEIVDPETWDEYLEDNKSWLGDDPEELEEYRHDFEKSEGKKPSWYVNVNLDTAYGYNENGIDCNELHARVILQLEAWLASRDQAGTLWWKNEYRGSYAKASDLKAFSEFLGHGAEAADWFQNIALPAIASGNPTGTR